MTPVTPIIPGVDLPVTKIAENREEYFTLPAFISIEGDMLVRWKLSWRERLKLLFTGDLYYWQMTFNRGVQPIMLTVDRPEPLSKRDMGEEGIL